MTTSQLRKQQRIKSTIVKHESDTSVALAFKNAVKS